MISYRIIDRDEFLEGLFHGSVWDNFFVVRAEISSYVRAEITPAAPCKWGRLKKDLQGLLEQMCCGMVIADLRTTCSINGKRRSLLH